MNANSFKFKQQQKNQPFFANFQSSNIDSKYNFPRPNKKSKRLPSSIKQQYLDLQSCNVNKKNRYDTFEDTEIRNHNFKSLSLERNKQSLPKNQQKMILFKRSLNNDKKTLRYSLQNSKKQLSPYRNKTRRNLLNRKLTIINNDSIRSQSKGSQQSIKNKELKSIEIENFDKNKLFPNQQKFRVKSTFCKLESIELTNSSVLYQSSSKTLTGRKKTIEMEKKPSKTNIELIKMLVKSEEYQKALLIIKDIFKEKNYKDDPQLIELFIHCMYNLEQYDEVTKIFDNVSNIQEKWNPEIYVIVCLSLAKQKSYKKSLEVIDKAAQVYSEKPQILYYKGKILYHMKKYDLAQETFKISNQMQTLPQTMICLADCYRKLNKKEQELEMISQILPALKTNLTVKEEDLLTRKFKLLLEIKDYQGLIQNFDKIKKLNFNIKNTQNKALIEFVYSFSKYKLDFLDVAYQKFQDCLTSQYFEKESLKMLIIIQIKSRNFYDTFHLCSQINKRQFSQKSDKIFDILTLFVEGSINLIRRNFKQGIQILSKVELLMQKQEYQKYRSQNLQRKLQDLANFEAFETVRNLLHLFLSYGLFSIGQYQFCQSAITKQRHIFRDPKYEKNMNFNYKLCDAILSFLQKQYGEVLTLLDQADQIYPNKLEVFFYRAVVLIKLLLASIQKSDQKQILQSEEGQKTITLIKANLDKCLDKTSAASNNTRATIFYYKSLFHAYLKEWKQSIISIDFCLSQSDQSYWRYHYCKGMILACVHNFEEAIDELNVAINFSEGQRAQCFLLRSRCLQIQGKGSEAFLDLQHYIGLKPDDNQVHKYAGQILFQNGAFEDALIAFSHQQIPQTLQNYDIFLTHSKTLFLTGKFNQAQQKMNIAYKLKSEQIQVHFDAHLIGFLDDLIREINSEQVKVNQFSLTQKLKQIFNDENQQKGKIFHQCDSQLFEALINIYSQNYKGAIKNFQKHLSEKKKMIIFDDNQLSSKQKVFDKYEEDEFEKTSKQLKIYTNQMKFNIVICYLALEDLQMAKSKLKEIKIDKKEPFYQNFCKFKSSIINQTFSIENQEILPNKNKLSLFLPPLQIQFKSKNIKFNVKICVPFPKVQPPQIFPVFDQKLLKTLTIFGIQGKAEAPWIVKEDNVIKFTEKMSYASRLDFEDSEHSDSRTVIIDLQNSQLKQKKQKFQKQKSTLFSKRTLKNKTSFKIH